MSRRNKASGPRVWRWRRWIAAHQQETWLEKLQTLGSDVFWTLTAKPSGTRVLVEAYTERSVAVEALVPEWGGRVDEVDGQAWIATAPVPPTRIGRKLEIVHDEMKGRSDLPQMHIPHGVAFGSGDHATTFMLLRALVNRANMNWSAASVLDVGTGSGVLALTARLLGARKIVATDFDADAIRTARQNETLNFPDEEIVWRCADVKKLSGKTKYDLVLANLFSGILCEAAWQIAASVAPGGELWLSGILRSQEREVCRAYRNQGLRLSQVIRRGKWVMVQWQRRRS